MNSTDVLKKLIKEHEDKYHKKGRFVIPTKKEINEEAKQIGYTIDADTFINFYGSKGWMIGKSKMKNWRLALRRAIKNGWINPVKIYKPKPPLKPILRTPATPAQIAKIKENIAHIFKKPRIASLTAAEIERRKEQQIRTIKGE